MMKIIGWFFAIIALFLILDNYLGATKVLSGLTDGLVRGTAVLQGRDVKGVTS